VSDFSGRARFAAAALVLLHVPLAAGAQTFSAAPPSLRSSRAAPDQPVAQLKIFSATSAQSVWPGEGSNAVSADICVASTTGRFRLKVMSQGGGRLVGTAGAGKLGYTIRFRDGSGAEQAKRADGQALVTFEATSPQLDCSAGANAKIEIDTSEADMLAQSAGQYVDRLVLSAEPL
jgi:hypothetical protein